MINKMTKHGGLLKVNNAYEGECIEREVEKILAGEGQFTVLGPPIYTPKKDGVWPSTNIRTDKMEVAQAAMDVANSKRMDYKPWMESKDLDNKEPEEAKD